MRETSRVTPSAEIVKALPLLAMKYKGGMYSVKGRKITAQLTHCPHENTTEKRERRRCKRWSFAKGRNPVFQSETAKWQFITALDDTDGADARETLEGGNRDHVLNALIQDFEHERHTVTKISHTEITSTLDMIREKSELVFKNIHEHEMVTQTCVLKCCNNPGKLAPLLEAIDSGMTLNDWVGWFIRTEAIPILQLLASNIYKEAESETTSDANSPVASPKHSPTRLGSPSCFQSAQFLQPAPPSRTPSLSVTIGSVRFVRKKRLARRRKSVDLKSILRGHRADEAGTLFATLSAALLVLSLCPPRTPTPTYTDLDPASTFILKNIRNDQKTAELLSHEFRALNNRHRDRLPTYAQLHKLHAVEVDVHAFPELLETYFHMLL